MEEDVILKISYRIKEIRKERGITIQELANRAGVSKGLISQIENNHTVPSLMVLIDLIKSLDVDLDQFFKDISASSQKATVLVKRKAEYKSFKKEQALGFLYQRILTKSINNTTVDIVLLELEQNATSPMATTGAFEYKYIMAGNIKYIFDDQEIELTAGDSLLFDGRLSHTPRNIGKEKAMMLMVYFFEETRA